MTFTADINLVRKFNVELCIRNRLLNTFYLFDYF